MHPPARSDHCSIWPRRQAQLIVLGSILLAACGGGKPRAPLVMEPAPREPGSRIDLDLPRDRSGAFLFDQWPKACALLTDADIKAVLPQVTRVAREPEDQKITLLPPISNDAIPAPPRDVTAKGAECRYKLVLPATGLVIDEKYGFSDASLRVSVDYAGSPKAVKQNFLASNDDERIAVPHGQCYSGGPTSGVSCRKGSLAFSITSAFQHLSLSDDGKWTDRYRVSGKLNTFTADGFSGSGSSKSNVTDNNRREKFRRDHLDAELAKTVLAKIRVSSR